MEKRICETDEFESGVKDSASEMAGAGHTSGSGCVSLCMWSGCENSLSVSECT